MEIEEHDNGDVTIEGTRYSAALFEEMGCNFPHMVGQILRIDKKEEQTITVTRLTDLEELAQAIDKLPMSKVASDGVLLVEVDKYNELIEKVNKSLYADSR